MNNLSLFSTKPSESGFRLYAYEVLNWGTFDQNIWSIYPEGETSLLTGANASGKTTLVDGLLTLLVPEKRMRFYNQTAGSKGERTEDSYVVGEYGETENSDTNTKEVKKLRENKSKAQSILLAVFQNESQFVTLVQTRWFSGSELKRNFIVAHKKLSIRDHFMPFDNTGEWKKRLKKRYPKQGKREFIQFTDSPGEYGRLMRKIFGMRSEKGHTLFSQTIGLKVLGNLDEFVRLQMLEERDAETEFQKIKTYFKTLNDAHRAIEKAHKQIELLSPIREKAQNLSVFKADLIHQESFLQTAPLWFAEKQKELILDYNEEQNARLESLSQNIVEYSNKIDELSDRERDLDIQIKSDKVGSQISTLERRNKELEDSRQERQDELKFYNQLAESLEFQPNPQSKELFEEQRKTAVAKKKKTGEVLEQNEKGLDQLKIDKYNLDKEFNALSDQLSVLRSQKNNITGHPARIRNEILNAVGATEKEIPFIGELVKVGEDAREWEPAIERLLHNFALRLIVPEEYYQQVNQYVKKNDLRGRIIYHRFNKKEVALQLFQQQDDKELIHKLSFKPSAYSEWIKNEISTKFNYLCVEDLETFRLANKAVTKEGIVKNANRHEKYDRPEIKNRQKYVLGWDNKEKIAVLKEEAHQLDQKIKELESRLKYLKNHQTRIKNEEQDLAQFITFKSYRKIDWWSIAAQIQENKQ
ncbi:MAG: ATP-binding protein, partial [Thermotogota bacterium]